MAKNPKMLDEEKIIPSLPDNAAIIAKKAFKENITLKEAAMKLKLVTEKEFDRIVDPKKMI